VRHGTRNVEETRHDHTLEENKAATLKKPMERRIFPAGNDFDNTMLRIGSMNMLLHGVESPDIRFPRESTGNSRRTGIHDARGGRLPRTGVVREVST
jgi:type I restriction-modification system DNA methylase subunit